MDEVSDLLPNLLNVHMPLELLCDGTFKSPWISFSYTHVAYYKKKEVGAGEMTEWIKCLPLKHEDLISDPSTQVKAPNGQPRKHAYK